MSKVSETLNKINLRRDRRIKKKLEKIHEFLSNCSPPLRNTDRFKLNVVKEAIRDIYSQGTEEQIRKVEELIWKGFKIPYGSPRFYSINRRRDKAYKGLWFGTPPSVKILLQGDSESFFTRQSPY